MKGVLSQGSSSADNQLPEHWQTSNKDENILQQNQQKEQQHLQSSECQSSQIELIQQGSSAKDQIQHFGIEHVSDQQPLQEEKTHCDNRELQKETNPLHSVEKYHSNNLEQNHVRLPKQDRAQLSENQQLHTMHQLTSRQAPAANNINNSRWMRERAIPFSMLIPILVPHLVNDQSMLLQSLFTRLRNNEISKDDFLRGCKNIVGDQVFRQAVQEVQVQFQAQAARNPPTNPNQYSLQTQAASQHISSHGAQFTEPQTFPHHPPSSQNQNGHNSPPHQPCVSASTIQMQIDTIYSNLENSSQKPQETENKSDGKGIPAGQMYSQTSFSACGHASNSFHTHAYPRSSVSAATTFLKQQNQTSQRRQVPQTCAMGSTRLGATQSMNVLTVPEYDLQNNSHEVRRLHSGSLTLENKEQCSTISSMAYVKKVVDHAVEPSQKLQGNPAFGSLKDDRLENQSSTMRFSTSTTMPGTNQISGSVVYGTAKISSATPPVPAGNAIKTPPKKPSIGQKRSDTLGTSFQPSKKPKTSGDFLDQSIEQLNDVTAVSGVNLREEEEQLLSPPKEETRASEATRRVAQEEEERLILCKASLQKMLADIMSKCGLESIGCDVEHCLSVCVEERLRGLLSYLIRLSKQRVDIEKTRHRFVITSDVRRQILMMNRRAKEEWDDKKRAEETDKLQKFTESEGDMGTDVDKKESRSKAIKANKEDDKMLTTAANVAARAAVGGDDMLSKWQLMAEQARQKREGRAGPSNSLSSREIIEMERRGSSSASLNESSLMTILGRSSLMMRRQKVACNISVKDVISVLEREPQMSRSTLIYRLYERMAGDSAAVAGL